MRHKAADFSSMRTPLTWLIASILAFTSCAVAKAGGFAVAGRVGAATEGADNTLPSGIHPALGLSIEWLPSQPWAVGFGYAYVHDGGSSDPAENPAETQVLDFDVHARRLFTQWQGRPYLELGLGYYELRYSFLYGVPDEHLQGPGFSIDAGLAVYPMPRLGLRVGGAYHYLVDDFSSFSWSSGDYLELSDGGVRVAASQLAALTHRSVNPVSARIGVPFEIDALS